MTDFSFGKQEIEEILWRELPERVRVFRRAVRIEYAPPPDRIIIVQTPSLYLKELFESSEIIDAIDDVVSRWFGASVKISAPGVPVSPPSISPQLG